MSKKTFKIIQFRENCIGCNSCVENSPDNWEINPQDGKACLKRSQEKNGKFIAEISELEVEANKRSAQYCPVGIIHINDPSGKDISYK